MSLCPICGRAMCDHTSSERGQTEDEMMAPMTPEEVEAWEHEPPDSPVKIAAGLRNRDRQQGKIDRDAAVKLKEIQEILEDNPCHHRTEDEFDPDCVLCLIRVVSK